MALTFYSLRHRHRQLPHRAFLARRFMVSCIAAFAAAPDAVLLSRPFAYAFTAVRAATRAVCAYRFSLVRAVVST